MHPDLSARLAPAGAALLHDAAHGQWLLFEKPEKTFSAHHPSEVIPVLREVAAAAENGLFAAGFVAYEAAQAFDPAFPARQPPSGLPLAWFGLYHAPVVATLPDAPPATPPLPWRPDITRDRYNTALARIRDYIAAGDTYQVNYTLRLNATLPTSPWHLFLQLQHAQQAPFGAFINTGPDLLCSASPELHFSLDGSRITCRPMKGTRPRGRWPAEDAATREALRASPKDRAENVMIVDMVRNDLGRIARPGSVITSSLFDIERFPTVWQMTSTVHADTTAPLPDIFRALFPCASVTGAPKIRAMQIIDELEPSPRGIYTGSIGFVAPNRRAQFNVAIRTAHVHPADGSAGYGTGGGIVWDSTTDDEYAECLAKAAILSEPAHPFRLLETLRGEPEEGYLFQARHLRRLTASAAYFSFTLDVDLVRRRLADAALRFPPNPQRVRLLVARDGAVDIESSDAEGSFHSSPDPSAPSWQLALAANPIPSSNRFLFHKTTRREVYDAARRERPGADDVILWNERGEVTESTIANVVVRFGEEWLTPPISCGLLAGVFREELLERGVLREQVLTPDDLAKADAVWLINSVRGWIPARFSNPWKTCP